MRRDPVGSDQSIDCSDGSENPIYSLPPQKTGVAALPGGFHRSAHPARFSHRAVSPLRQTRMQVRGWCRARTQVLPLCQLSRSEAGAGLRSPGAAETRRAIPCELPETEGPPGKHLRHQSRTAAQEGGAVADGWRCHERYFRRCRSHRGRAGPDAARASAYQRRLADRSAGGHR